MSSSLSASASAQPSSFSLSLSLSLSLSIPHLPYLPFFFICLPFLLSFLPSFSLSFFLPSSTWTTLIKLPRHMPISSKGLAHKVLLTKASLKARVITHPINPRLNLLAPLFHHRVPIMASRLAGSKSGTRQTTATSSTYSLSPLSIPRPGLRHLLWVSTFRIVEYSTHSLDHDILILNQHQSTHR